MKRLLLTDRLLAAAFVLSAATGIGLLLTAISTGHAVKRQQMLFRRIKR